MVTPLPWHWKQYFWKVGSGLGGAGSAPRIFPTMLRPMIRQVAARSTIRRRRPKISIMLRVILPSVEFGSPEVLGGKGERQVTAGDQAEELALADSQASA